MKRPYKSLIFLILWASLMLLGTRSAPASNGVLAAADRALPPVVQPLAPDASTNKVTPPVRTFPMTRFEHDVRRKMDFRVEWVSPHEGRVVVSRGEGRWHRAGAWRRNK